MEYQLLLVSQRSITSGTQPSTQGRSPWNKGKKMSPATKQKISNAQKKRWRESPTLRATMESKLKVSNCQSTTPFV